MVRILVVERDRLTCEGYVGTLQAHGFDVTAQYHGKAGLLASQRLPFHLAIVDMELPDISGLDFIRALRSNGSSPLVIAATSVGTVSATVAAMKLGAVDVVEKPLGSEELVRVVRGALSDRSAGFVTSDQPSTSLGRRAIVHEGNHLDVDERIAEVVRIIERDYAKPLRPQEIGARVNLGTSRLQHLFTSSVGISMTSFVRARRLMVAARLLTESHSRVSDVCYAVGFGTLAGFDRAFRRRYGKSPREYRLSGRTRGASSRVGDELAASTGDTFR